MDIRRRYDLPPQPRMQLPLLWIIARSGGAVWVSSAREAIAAELAEIFCLPSERFDESTNDGKESRWWNHIRQVRRMLVDKGGLQPIGHSGRDHWALTTPGWLRLFNFLKPDGMSLEEFRDRRTLARLDHEFMARVRKA